MIIVTGAAGFIGSALIWKLNRLGEDNILAVDSLESSNKWKNLTGLRLSDYMEKDDFLEAVVLGRFGPKVRTIFHMGACSDTTETDASYLIKNNFEYTKQLAEFAAENDARLIYASSAATYGDGSAGYSDDADPAALRPLNAYAFSKNLFDLWAARKNLFDRIVGLKYFNVFGPNEYHKGDMRSMVCKGFGQVQAKGVVKLFKSYRGEYTDGEQVRDFIYIKDAVNMTLHFYIHPDKCGLFNVGSGVETAWNALIGAIFESLGLEPEIEYIDMPKPMRRKYQYHTKAEMGKLNQAGYDKPATPIKEAVSDYVQNYLIPGKRLQDDN